MKDQTKTVSIVTALPKIAHRKRVAAYARVSSGKDAMLHSLSAQISYYSAYIQRNPLWEFVGIYVDEATTGTKDNRKEFQKMLEDCRSGKIDLIITKSVSRFARNTVEVYQKRYDELVAKYDQAKYQLKTLEKEKKERAAKKENLQRFLKVLEQTNTAINDFNENLWRATVESVTIYSKPDLLFTFRDGIKVWLTQTAKQS